MFTPWCAVRTTPCAHRSSDPKEIPNSTSGPSFTGDTPMPTSPSRCGTFLSFLPDASTCFLRNPSPLQLWARGLLRDLLLGRARLQTVEPETSCSRVIDLREGRTRARVRGCVYVETSSSVCLTELWDDHGEKINNSQVKKRAKVLKLDGKQAALHWSAGQIFCPDPWIRICQIYKYIFKITAVLCCFFTVFQLQNDYNKYVC